MVLRSDSEAGPVGAGRTEELALCLIIVPVFRAPVTGGGRSIVAEAMEDGLLWSNVGKLDGI